MRAPHTEGPPRNVQQAPNAALLIDFDNVTMGMRSDLSKELKSLLNSDIIKGKVAVQRAYADWRRYPQYIVPLSEASIDLIFAPAYGSSKKNATDIRLAIDALELVFTRPEIGTFILLSGDSDFSSLVLKLKEYGKYVIGVGIQESSSDILVQNCDEYYSYTALAGLKKTSEITSPQLDPWVLVERSLDLMVERGDVMRSDRLKQVMLEIDPGFQEKNFGFNKFRSFLSEAASRGLVTLHRLENGQYEVHRTDGEAGGSRRSGRGREGEEARSRRGEERAERDRERGKDRDRREDRSSRHRREDDRRTRPEERSREQPAGSRAGKGEEERSGGRAALEPRPDSRGGRPEAHREKPPVEPEARAREADKGVGEEDPLGNAYQLLGRAVADLVGKLGRDAVRDSDVKRRMLSLDPAFDESELGFGKFSRFLRQAHDHEVIDLRKRDSGNYEVALRERSRAKADLPPRPEPSLPEKREDVGVPAEIEATATRGPAVEEPAGKSDSPSESGPPGGGPAEAPRVTMLGRLRHRAGSRKRWPRLEAPPSVFEGQVPASDEVDSSARPGEGSAPPVPGRGGDLAALSTAGEGVLPTDVDGMVRYLSTRYRGVGRRTAVTLVEQFGERLFHVLEAEPDRVREVVPPARAEKVLGAWAEDRARRSRTQGQAAGGAAEGGPSGEEPDIPTVGRISKRRTRRGSRRSRKPREDGSPST